MSKAYGIILGRVVAGLRGRQTPALTQAALAARVGVAQASISRMESGWPHTDLMVFLGTAAALGLTHGALLEQINRAHDCTERAARATLGDAAGPDPLASALARVGPAGLSALADYAVALMLADNAPP